MILEQYKANLATDPKIKTNLQNAVRAAIQRKEFFTEERNLYELEMAVDFIEKKCAANTLTKR